MGYVGPHGTALVDMATWSHQSLDQYEPFLAIKSRKKLLPVRDIRLTWEHFVLGPGWDHLDTLIKPVRALSNH